VKLLFDQNISYRVVKLVKAGFPNSTHISSIGLANATDRSIWNTAKKEGFTIVTFDQDYLEFAALRGAPPKIILIRSGNMGTLAIAHLLDKYRPRIMEFMLDQTPEGMAVLELP